VNPILKNRRLFRLSAEWADAEGAEISQIRNFMVDFRLNDEGELELKEFGESCWDSILEKAYPRLLEAMTAPMTAAGGPTGCLRHQLLVRLL